jgi:hypothetical protein
MKNDPYLQTAYEQLLIIMVGVYCFSKGLDPAEAEAGLIESSEFKEFMHENNSIGVPLLKTLHTAEMERDESRDFLNEFLLEEDAVIH